MKEKLYPYTQETEVIPLDIFQYSRIRSKFPRTSDTNRTSRELWWLLLDRWQKTEQLRALTNTFKTHLHYNLNRNEDHEAKIQLGKMSTREDKLTWILKCPWTAFEFFLVDALQRNKFYFKNLRLKHTKWSPILDHKWKIDFLSTAKYKDKKTTIGVQLTTEKSHIDQYENHQEYMKKKKAEVLHKSVLCKTEQDNYIESLPNDLKPDLTSYMVVNGSINKQINLDKNNIFLKAFKQRKKEWFNEKWPTIYLPKFVQKELGIIRHAYQRSIKQYIDFVEKNKELPTEERYTMTTHNNIYHLIATYTPDRKELQYKVFYDEKDKSTFLFYISYFLHNEMDYN